MKNDNYSIMRALSLFTQLGLNMASCVLIGVLLGNFFDWLFGTAPWLTLVFAFIGAAAAFKVLYDIVKGWID